MEKEHEIGLTVKKSQDLSEWYSQVTQKAELVDYATIKGFMVLKPYGYIIWEIIAQELDRRFKELGVLNAFVPSVIPESFLKKEQEHFQGFVPEVFWISQAGDEMLSERLALRPTSETIAYYFYAKWIKSWRDLPLKLNFWNSMFRAEIKMTKPFIRTSEALWQEGHTAHASKEEADEMVRKILSIYVDVVQNMIAIPVLTGYKTEREKFAGALYTTTLESIMPDGKALQMGTSHNLGQNFARAFDIKFLGKDGGWHYVWQTSWGVSWRLIGAMIMSHGDDKGLLIPPKVAPIQIVFVPIYYEIEQLQRIIEYASFLTEELRKNQIRVLLDDRTHYTPGWKFNHWELLGVPLRVEIGPRDLSEQVVIMVRRDTGERIKVPKTQAIERAVKLLDEIQSNLFHRSSKFLEASTREVQDYEEFIRTLEQHRGFLKAGWCGSSKCEEEIKNETGADIRVIPLQTETTMRCIKCGNTEAKKVIFAKAY